VINAVLPVTWEAEAGMVSSSPAQAKLRTKYLKNKIKTK
jgi:hypothetical protein